MNSALKVYERHYPFPAAIAAAFHFAVNGDNPRGAECVYYGTGVLVPLQTPWPIELVGLQAQVKVVASGNQWHGLMMHLWIAPGPTGDNINLVSGVSTPLAPLLSWQGRIPCDWGFGFSLHSAVSILTANIDELVINAQYRLRGRDE